MSAGAKFRQVVKTDTPLQLVGTINAYCAIQAQKSGFKAIYLSGAGVSNYSLGRPDDGQTITLEEVKIDARRILSVTDLPLIIDIDTGFDDPEKTVRELCDLGVAGVHMEDQVPAKLCGHLPGKQLVSKEEMGERIKSARAGKTDPDFVVMARCDALAVEGFDAVVERSSYYVEQGADMIFAEAMTDLGHYQHIKNATNVPLLANMTEFGKTRLYSANEFAQAGVDIVLYPLSAVRGMAKSAQEIYEAILRDGDQANVIDQMQKRNDLYETLNYDAAVDEPASMKK